MRGAALVVCACAALAVPAAAGAQGVAPVPIEEGTARGQGPDFIGAPAVANPVRGIVQPPRHPFMAPNGRSNLHNDAYQTDTYVQAGPLGRQTQTISTQLGRECGSLTFNTAGQIVTVCIGLEGPLLALIDPRTLALLATHPLPLRMPGPGNPFTDFSGGGYFYLDHLDRAVVSTTDRRVLVIALRQGASGPEFVQERAYDLTAAVPPGDGINSAVPDFSGRIWFVSTGGVVGYVDPDSGAVTSQVLPGEAITNSFAVGDDGGVYIVSTKALYRFEAAPGGGVTTVWREEYANTGERKSGQTSAGSGTTPTLMENGWVAITDNADPVNVVVYRRERAPAAGRVVCTQPVFRKGESSTDQSLIVAGRSIVAENNFGYTGPASTTQGGVTSPGIERVDVAADGKSCRTVWRSEERAPSVVPKLSLAAGLVYTYTKDPEPGDNDAWYLTALDFRTGATVYKRLAGGGLGFNNNFAPVTIGPDGTLYVGVLAGLVLFRDRDAGGPAPGPAPGPGPGPRPGNRPRPRLNLRLDCARARRGCPVRVTVVGPDRALVRRAVFTFGRRTTAPDRRAPFRRVARRDVRRISVRVLLSDGRRATLRRSIIPIRRDNPRFTG